MKLTRIGGETLDIRFKEVFDLYKDDIYRLSYSYTKNFAEADDIT